MNAIPPAMPTDFPIVNIGEIGNRYRWGWDHQRERRISGTGSL